MLFLQRKLQWTSSEKDKNRMKSTEQNDKEDRDEEKYRSSYVKG